MTQLVEIVLTEEQVGLLSVAAGLTLRSNEDTEHGLITLTEEEQADYERLAVFLTTVAANPQHFPVTGRMARSIKKRTLASRLPRPAAGDTARSVRNKRKARQEKRQGASKRRRKERREHVAAFNKARERYEADVKEMQEIQEQRQREIENEPKFDVTDIMGNVVIAGVPKSMIRPVVNGADLVDEHAEDLRLLADAPKIILPGSAEHLGVTE